MNMKWVALLLGLAGLRWATAQQPLGHWHFDEGVGTNTMDVSGNNSPGTLIGVALPVWTSGVSSNALGLDAVQNEVQIPDAPVLTPTNTLTVMAWVKTATNLTSDVLGKWSTNAVAGSYLLGLTNGQVRLELMLNGQSVSVIGTNAGLPSAGWNLVAGTYDGTQMVVDINGPVTGSRAAGGTVDVVGEPLRAGLLTGRLDDVRIYAAALMEHQLGSLVNADSDDDGLPDYWEVSHGTNPHDARDGHKQATKTENAVAKTNSLNPMPVRLLGVDW